jgi:hypothetical protein
MSLEILVILVVVGVSAVVAAVRLSGVSRQRAIADARQAKSLFAARYPDELPRECLRASDEKAAFLLLPDGRIGLVSVFGARYVCRLFERKDIQFRQRGDEEITLRFPDFGFPGGTYRFARVEDTQRLIGWLEGDVIGDARSGIS